VFEPRVIWRNLRFQTNVRSDRSLTSVGSRLKLLYHATSLEIWLVQNPHTDGQIEINDKKKVHDSETIFRKLTLYTLKEI
jgi:hypothetical protein